MNVNVVFFNIFFCTRLLGIMYEVRGCYVRSASTLKFYIVHNHIVPRLLRNKDAAFLIWRKAKKDEW
jgi:hypothetical protein